MGHDDLGDVGRAQTPDLLVHTFEKNRRESIRTTLSTFKGRRRLDLRTYALDDETGDLVPTRKGVSLPVELAGELTAAVTAAQAAIEAERAA